MFFINIPTSHQIVYACVILQNSYPILSSIRLLLKTFKSYFKFLGYVYTYSDGKQVRFVSPRLVS